MKVNFGLVFLMGMCKLILIDGARSFVVVENKRLHSKFYSVNLMIIVVVNVTLTANILLLSK